MEQQNKSVADPEDSTRGAKGSVGCAPSEDAGAEPLLKLEY